MIYILTYIANTIHAFIQDFFNWIYHKRVWIETTVDISILVLLALFLASGAVALRTQEELAEKVVRLHVLANSDSTEDQALKLKVRDTILESASARLKNVRNSQEAAAQLLNILPELEREAEQVISENGFHYSVAAELQETEFPTKAYDGFTLPAGQYLALRVIIGAGKGHNWWCVVFPPLCTALSTDVPAMALASGLSEEQVNLITEGDTKYILKFKTVELWENLRQSLNP